LRCARGAKECCTDEWFEPGSSISREGVRPRTAGITKVSEKGAGSTSGGGEIKHGNPPISRMAGFDGESRAPCCNGMMYTTSADVVTCVGMCARLPLFALDQKINTKMTLRLFCGRLRTRFFGVKDFRILRSNFWHSGRRTSQATDTAQPNFLPRHSVTVYIV